MRKYKGYINRNPQKHEYMYIYICIILDSPSGTSTHVCCGFPINEIPYSFQLYEQPSIHPSVHPSVHPSIHPSNLD